MLVVQSCLTLCNPMNCSPPGSSVHGNLQAGILEWIAIPFSDAEQKTENQVFRMMKSQALETFQGFSIPYFQALEAVFQGFYYAMIYLSINTEKNALNSRSARCRSTVNASPITAIYRQSLYRALKAVYSGFYSTLIFYRPKT